MVGKTVDSALDSPLSLSEMIGTLPVSMKGHATWSHVRNHVQVLKLSVSTKAKARGMIRLFTSKQTASGTTCLNAPLYGSRPMPLSSCPPPMNTLIAAEGDKKRRSKASPSPVSNAVTAAGSFTLMLRGTHFNRP